MTAGPGLAPASMPPARHFPLSPASVTRLSPAHATIGCERNFEALQDLFEMSGQHALESFVARIWLEHEPDGEAVWRGHIQHVQNSRESYFQDLGELCEFLERVTGVPGPAGGRATETDATIPEFSNGAKKNRDA